MARLHAEYATVIAARPAEIYAILSDYHHGHPQILPKQYFPALTVEQGGQGAGTVFRVQTRALGVERGYRMVVSEPDPGHVLVETDIETDLTTTFTVTPVGDADYARVQIATDWESAPGIGGAIEKLVTPLVMRRIYRTELGQLAAYVASKRRAAVAADLPENQASL
ncbi:MAG TPA: SRPBCC family protein [Herpetosiphonaceae bacterium]